MITEYENFLEENLFFECFVYSKYIFEKQSSIKTSVDLCDKQFDVNVVPILTHKISNINEDLSNRIASYVKEKLSLQDYTVDPRMYFYKPGSHIAWHDDSHWFATVTIYIVKEWDINNGGLFLYKDQEGKIRGISPEKNLAVFQTEATPHAVSPLVNNSPIRTVIHCFVYK